MQRLHTKTTTTCPRAEKTKIEQSEIANLNHRIDLLIVSINAETVELACF